MIGVIECFSRKLEKPDTQLLSIFNIIGTQLGQYINRKENEQKIRFLNSYQTAILDNAGYSIISTDVNGKIKSFNPAAEKM
ncbi:hypothetical protein B4Q13_25250, partial [Lacticaseibacillus rhamnosus]